MKAAPDRVVVRAGARLHLGLVKTGAPGGYIAAGLSLESPYCEIEVIRSSRLSASGFDKGRVRDVLSAVCEALGERREISARIMKPLPAHTGFGSGTRHSLCVAKGVFEIFSRRTDYKRLAKITGRGGRSMMGSILFSIGGLVTDEMGNINSASVPSRWRVVLIYPVANKKLKREFYGASEDGMIALAKPCAPKVCERLSGHVLANMAKGAEKNDFELFAKSVNELQTEAAKVFGTLQEGAASTASGSAILKRLKRSGFKAIGQSSWGPALFAVTPSEKEAEALAEKVRGWKETESVAVSKIQKNGYRVVFE